MTDRSASRKAKRDALSPPRCEIPDCEWTYNFQRHRIVPGRDGGKYKKGNVISLCPNHHAMADDSAIPAEHLLEIVQNRIDEELTQQPELGTTDSTTERHCSPEEPCSCDGVCSADAADGIGLGVSG